MLKIGHKIAPCNNSNNNSNNNNNNSYNNNNPSVSPRCCPQRITLYVPLFSLLGLMTSSCTRSPWTVSCIMGEGQKNTACVTNKVS